MQYLTIPCSGKQIYDGSVVMLPRFPGVRWIVHWGWYTYHEVQYQGWYLQAIPANTVIPLDTSDLNVMYVIDPQIPFTPDRAKDILRRAFITVDVPLQMTSIPSENLCQGKMFRVNYPHHEGPVETLSDEDEYDPQFWVAVRRDVPNVNESATDDSVYEFRLMSAGEDLCTKQYVDNLIQLYEGSVTIITSSDT